LRKNYQKNEKTFFFAKKHENAKKAEKTRKSLKKIEKKASPTLGSREIIR